MEPKTIKTIFSFWGMFLISECLCKLWNVICIVISPFDCVIKIYSSHTIHNSPRAINNNIHSVKIFFISFYNSGSTCRNIMVFNACVYLYGADIFPYELACRLLSGHVHSFQSDLFYTLMFTIIEKQEQWMYQCKLLHTEKTSTN